MIVLHCSKDQTMHYYSPLIGLDLILTFTLHKQYGDTVVFKVMFYVPTGSDQQHMITPRRLPFTVINNVAHYDNMDHTGSPFSCILQGATQNSHTLPANTGKFVVFAWMKFCVHNNGYYYQSNSSQYAWLKTYEIQIITNVPNIF